VECACSMLLEHIFDAEGPRSARRALSLAPARSGLRSSLATDPRRTSGLCCLGERGGPWLLNKGSTTA
ncbi:hypothetical protein NDU88_002793, partial [Pleurodeles waltl]